MQLRQISFGKWRGYEIFHNDLNTSGFPPDLQEEIFLRIQLPLELIQIYPGVEIFSMVVLEWRGVPINIYCKYTFSIDGVGRPGYLAGAIVVEEGILEGDEKLEILEKLMEISSRVIKNQDYPIPDLSGLQPRGFCNNLEYLFPDKVSFILLPEKISVKHGYHLIPRSEIFNHSDKVFFSKNEIVKNGIAKGLVDIYEYEIVAESAEGYLKRLALKWNERKNEIN